MTPELAEGLRVSVIGLALVFLALGMLIILLVILGRISNWLLESQERRDAPPPEIEPSLVTIDAGADDELAAIAAIAVALVLARSKGGADQSLGRLLHQPGW